MNPVRKTIDRWLGRGDASITVPPMDGAFRPNDLLDSASPVIMLPSPDCLAVTAHGPVVSAGRSLFRVDRSDSAPLISLDAEISALAGLPDGGAAAGLVDGRIVFVGGERDGRTIAAGRGIACITAILPGRDGALIVANGSEAHAPTGWISSLMEKDVSGSLWRIEPDGGARQQIAGNLAYPHGLVEDADGIVVSESWRSALTRIQPGRRGRNASVLENLPAYPGRLSRGAGDTIWLALFAPRSQLIEFVLTENRYRRKMMRDISPDLWVAPSLRAGRTPQEPTQQGGVTQLGVLKPRSPTRSYGLVARLDNAYRPLATFHSRAAGHRHGVTSCLAFEGQVLLAVKGDGMVASLAHEGSAP